MKPIGNSPELERIINLPWRDSPPHGSNMLSARIARGSQELWPIQAWALSEIFLEGGLFAPIRVGGGKTLISFLAATMLGAKSPALLIPASLRGKTKKDYMELEKHWPLEPLKIISYQLLGRVSGSDILQDYQPDLIIADEAHRLKNTKAAVTRRVGRYMSKYPDTKFVALSGTMTKRSLMDFAHVMQWCLSRGSPIPLELYELEKWSQALDEQSKWKFRRHPGAILSRLPGEGSDIFEKARKGFSRRMKGTSGVITSDDKSIGSSINIRRWGKPTDRITVEIENFEKTWELPDGQTFIEALDIWRHSRELVQGFWYHWVPDPPEHWLKARKVWAAYARAVLSRSFLIDSAAQVADQRPDEPKLVKWLSVRDDYKINTVPVWFDQRILDQVLGWSETPGIVWVEHQTVGQELGRLGLPYYGRNGLNSSGGTIEEADGSRSIVASIAANAEGRNLQAFSRNLVLSVPTTGDKWEQLIGRTHRAGQKADEVVVDIYLGHEGAFKAFWQAYSDANYQREVLGFNQKLLDATLIDMERDEENESV